MCFVPMKLFDMSKSTVNSTTTTKQIESKIILILNSHTIDRFNKGWSKLKAIEAKIS